MKRKVQKPLGRTFLKIGLGILAGLLVVVLVYAGYVLLSYHRIEDRQTLTVEAPEKASGPARIGEAYSILTYNIGFGAYTPNFTFFMDGGTSSWAFSEESTRKTVGFAAQLMAQTDADILLVQEVDRDATRSYHVDQLAILKQAFPDYYSQFAVNYDSAFLFYPFHQPHGKSLAGMAVFSRLPISSALRRSLPISDSLSKFLDLDRCYTVSRIPVENGRELVIYNVHLSAYGNSDAVRQGQKQMLRQDMTEEVARGNYVICGGDFNHDLLATSDTTDVQSWAYPYPRSYLPLGMSFGLDLLDPDVRKALSPTCRNADIPYKPGESLVLTVDGFIISGNIQLLRYETVKTGFLYSDHDPVLLEFSLKN